MLKDNNLAVKTTDVIALAIEDKPGGLAKVLAELKKDDISIEYMYAFIGKTSNAALVVVRVDKPDEAIKILEDTNVNVVDAKDIYRL